MGMQFGPLRSLMVGMTACVMGPVPSTGWAQATTHSPSPLHLPTLADLPHLREFTQVAVSANGRWVAYVMSAPFHMSGQGARDRALEASWGTQINLLDLRNDRTIAVKVSGPPHALQWSPSTATLAFLISSEGRNRLWRCSPLEAGAMSHPIAASDSLGGSVMAFAWSPTGDSIAFLASEEGAPGHETATARGGQRLVLFRDAPGEYTGSTSPAYTEDTVGAYVAVVASHGGRANVLARHVVSSQVGPELDWSRRGSLLISGAPIGVGYWKKLSLRVLYTFDPSTRQLNRVAPESEARMNPVWSRSGRWIAYLRADYVPREGGPAFSHTLQVQDPTRPATTRILSPESDGLTGAFHPVWSADDSVLYIARYQKGTARLYAVDVATRRWRALTPASLSLSRYAFSHDGSVVIAELESANQPPELFRVDIASGSLTRLTHQASNLPPMRLGHIDDVAWTSSDGRFTVHGFLVKPPDYDSTRHYPLIVQIHGGPGGLFTNSFVAINFAPQYIPPQLLAAAGYLVLLPNPRGDPSYGEEFQAAVRMDWGPGPFGDVNAGISSLIARGLVDSTAVGIAGASYGGYLTAYAISQTPRFAAASINDGPVDLVSEYGQNYATRSQLDKWYFDGTPWARPDIYARQSPITYASRVRAPVLMRYGGRSSTGDNVRQSYMLAQGLEFYAALHDNGVPVQFVLHPDQGHGIHDWALYKDWVLRNLCWFDYWLRHEGHNPLVGDQR